MFKAQGRVLLGKLDKIKKFVVEKESNVVVLYIMK